MTTYAIILIVVILLGVPTIILVNKYPKTRQVFQILYFILIVAFGYMLLTNVKKPILFEKELDKRERAVIERIKEIRTIQQVYKDKYGRYIGDIDSLVLFVKYDSIENKNLIAVSEWNQDEVTKEEALKKGILKLSIDYVPAIDSLWKNAKYPIEEIKYIPYTQQIPFFLAQGELETASKVKVKVYECYALYKDVMVGMDKQLTVNYIDEKTRYGGFEGIRVGSLTEATNNAGNWEK